MQAQDSVQEQLFGVNTFFLGQHIAMKKMSFSQIGCESAQLWRNFPGRNHCETKDPMTAQSSWVSK